MCLIDHKSPEFDHIHSSPVLSHLGSHKSVLIGRPAAILVPTFCCSHSSLSASVEWKPDCVTPFHQTKAFRPSEPRPSVLLAPALGLCSLRPNAHSGLKHLLSPLPGCFPQLMPFSLPYSIQISFLSDLIREDFSDLPSQYHPRHQTTASVPSKALTITCTVCVLLFVESLPPISNLIFVHHGSQHLEHLVKAAMDTYLMNE